MDKSANEIFNDWFTRNLTNENKYLVDEPKVTPEYRLQMLAILAKGFCTSCGELDPCRCNSKAMDQDESAV